MCYYTVDCFLIRYTYEVAPVFILMEDGVLRRKMELIGWEDGGDRTFIAGAVTDRSVGMPVLLD